MTRLSPFWALNRLVVTRGEHTAFEQEFNLGLNVMSGENGSGKTTIADFIIYSLGGEPRSWREAALECDLTLAEVSINDGVVTFKREVSSSKQRPLAVYWGPLADARKADVTEWELYPFAGHGDRSSFSQVLFRTLGIPEVKTDKASRITIHQLIRLLYIDQTTSFREIFVHEDFDSHQTREAVGELLFGVYDQGIYDGRRRIRELEVEIAVLKKQLNIALHILGPEEEVLSSQYIEQEISNLKRRRTALHSQLEQAQKEPFESGSKNPREKEARDRVAKELSTVRDRRLALEQKGRNTGIEVADLEAFLESIDHRLRALDDVDVTHEYLGEVEFRYCPACYAPLTDQTDDKCRVCGNVKGATAAAENRMRMRRELEQQTGESQARLDQLREALGKMVPELRGVLEEEERLTLRFRELSAVRTDADFAVAELYRDMGYVDREIEHLNRRLRLADRLGGLSQSRADLTAELETLTDDVAAREVMQATRRREVYSDICRITKELLVRDLPREDEFAAPDDVTFDLAMNTVKVNGRDNFAASSMVYLKNTFHLALFLTSTEHDYMRLPRFMVFDNVEDKGMEAERSHNFQDVVAQYSDELETDHQLILFTSMLSPNIASTVLEIRPPFDHDRKSLDLPS